MYQNQNKPSESSSKSSEPSTHLSREENELVFKLIGKRCLSQCTSIAQLMLTEPPNGGRRWVKKHTGVVCFIKDNALRSYFIRMYCLTKLTMVWEQEIYDEIEIIRSKPYFLTFEGQESDGMVALNFSFLDEADSFMYVSTSTVERRKRRRVERSQTTPVTLRSQNAISTPSPQLALQKDEPKDKKSKDKKKKKKKLTKADIGTPVKGSFQHRTHFDLKGQGFGKDIEMFLTKAGVTEEQLNNRETCNFINKFLEQNNVPELVKTEKSPPPLPARNPGNFPSRRTQAPLPPIPDECAPPLPRNGPPSHFSSGPPPPPSISSGPPPPPPPVFEMPTALEPLKERGGGPRMPMPVAADPRDELMKAIRGGGAVLKKVDPSERQTDSSKGGNTTDILASALNMALQKRSGAIRDSSSEDDNETDDDLDDWDE